MAESNRDHCFQKSSGVCEVASHWLGPSPPFSGCSPSSRLPFHPWDKRQSHNADLNLRVPQGLMGNFPAHPVPAAPGLSSVTHCCPITPCLPSSMASHTVLLHPGKLFLHPAVWRMPIHLSRRLLQGFLPWSLGASLPLWLSCPFTDTGCNSFHGPSLQDRISKITYPTHSHPPHCPGS